MDEEKIRVLSNEVNPLFKKEMISKVFPLNTSLGKGPSCDPDIVIELKLFDGNVRAKISVKLLREVNPVQVMSVELPF